MTFSVCILIKTKRAFCHFSGLEKTKRKIRKEIVVVIERRKRNTKIKIVIVKKRKKIK